MTTFRQSQKVLEVLKDLRRYGIEVTLNGDFRLHEDMWELESRARDHFYPFGDIPLTIKEQCTLALACLQEEQNDFIRQSQIDLVNNFFEIKITFDDIQEFNTLFI